ncbi:MAG: AAA family ATPase [Parvibaculaceae bacterium]
MTKTATVSLQEIDLRARSEGIDEPDAGEKLPPELTPGRIKATPWSWQDPAKIPPRRWLYGVHRLRQFVSVTFAPGGMGKTSLLLTEALAQVTGRPLLGEIVHERAKVWMWNGEDPMEEIHRRIAAACIAHDIRANEIEGRLFIDSGRDMPMIVVRKVRDDLLIAEPVVEAIIEQIEQNRVDTLIIDPFVLSHSVPENDNTAIDRVVRQWARIADITGCAIELVHHVRKGSIGQSEFTVEDGRGAVALLAAARSARVLNRMSKEEGETAEVENHRQFFRIDNGKANLAPPADKTKWHRIESVALPNGDNVGAVVAWKWPDPLAGLTVNNLIDVQKAVDGKQLRRSSQAADWIGYAIAKVAGLNAEKDKARINAMVGLWIKSGALRVATVKDEKGKERPILEVGTWADS